MVPRHPEMDEGSGARAAAIGMVAVAAIAMLIALFGWHPWVGPH